MEHCLPALEDFVRRISERNTDFITSMQRQLEILEINCGGKPVIAELSRSCVPDETATDAFYVEGKRNGFSRTCLVNGHFLCFGRYVCGVGVGTHWRHQRMSDAADTFLIGSPAPETDPSNEESPPIEGRGVYLFPDLIHAIVGQFSRGKLQYGYFGVVMALCWESGGVPVPIVNVTSQQTITYDPATFTRISLDPLLPDPYETKTVEVRPSLIPLAGEGLFAVRPLNKGHLVAVFNGLRIPKQGRGAVTISAESEDWSDYRIELDRSTDLDVPLDLTSLSEYRASLAHKACHSFERNAAFKQLYHPRFGQVMCLVAARSINTGEEILVNYNYAVASAPQWYQQLWRDHNEKTNTLL